MTNLIVHQKYLWKGLTVTLKHLADGAATISPTGSSHVIFADAEELSPLPSKGESLSQAMQVSDSEWTRAVELADEFKDVLAAGFGKTGLMGKVANRFGLSLRATYNALKKYRRNPSPHALLPNKAGRKLGSRVLTIRRETVIAQVIDEKYCSAEKPSAAAVHGEIKIRCEKEGLASPSPGTVRKRIKSINLAHRIATRDGEKCAREVCGPAAGHLLLTRPLERVEIDHTLVDCMLVSDTKPRRLLGRPWVTIAIDCHTRMVLGFYISFERPSSVSVALCIAHALLSKSEWLRVHGVPGEWPCFGFPESVWVDNALEFRSLALRRGCETYQIKLCYRPAGEPQIGGTIERLIGTMMGRVHLLPGTTQSNISKRGKYDPAKSAQMTLSQFIAWFTSEIVTQYHTTTHRGIGKPPLVAWKQALEKGAPAEPGVPLEVLASFLPTTTRVLRRTGIERNRTGYWSDAFSPYIGQKLRVSVHDYPLDREHVYVRLPNGELTVATAKHKTPVPAKTVLDHLLQAAEDRQLENSPELKQVRHEGYSFGQDVVRTAASETKAANRTPRVPPPAAAAPTLKLYRPKQAAKAIAHIKGDPL